MPMYDMRCKDCGKKFELFCSWEKMKESKCPKCGSSNISQSYTGVAVLKGSGGSTSSPRATSRKFG